MRREQQLLSLELPLSGREVGLRLDQVGDALRGLVLATIGACPAVVDESEFVAGRRVALSTHMNADGDGCVRRGVQRSWRR